MSYKCTHCRRKFKILSKFREHVERCEKEEIGDLVQHPKFNLSKSAFNNTFGVYSMRDVDTNDVDTLFSNESSSLTSLLEDLVNKLECVKITIGVWFVLERPSKDDGDDENKTVYINSSKKVLCNDDYIQHFLGECSQEIDAKLDVFTQEGSGWSVQSIKEVEVHLVKYEPHQGGCKSCSLPKHIITKKAIVNMDCTTDCFMYCVLGALHPVDQNPQRVFQYDLQSWRYDFSSCRGEVKTNQINKFEKTNNVSVNVYTLSLNEENIIPFRITSELKDKHVNLFFHDNHYFLISNFDRLLNMKRNHGEKHCLNCLHGFRTHEKLMDHQPNCFKRSPQQVVLPKKGEIIEFKEYKKMFKYPFIIYADFETLATKLPHENKNSFAYQEHKPCSYGFVVIDYKGDVILKDFYRGLDADSMFMKTLIAVQMELYLLYDNLQKPLYLTLEEEARFYIEDKCHICGSGFDHDSDKVRDHDHMTGEFRGPAHNACNLQWKWDYKIPVVFHNLKNFDGHLLIQAVDNDLFTKIDCIPQTIDKYLSIQMDSFVFIDSLAFLPSSLDNLARNLDRGDKVKILEQIFTDGDIEMLLGKACLPYEYLDCISRFDEPSLPPIDAFFSSLTNSGISVEAYDRMNQIFQDFNCSTLGEFHDIYLKVDVCLLAAIFENFRKMSLCEFGLDPANFFSTPGLTWLAALKMTKVKLDHITDIDMLMMLENGIRGGVSSAMTRHAKANNSSCPDYNSNEPKSFITYLDVNNLYGYALRQKLPHEKGYILEVDLDYPKDLHDWHDDYPLAVEQMTIEKEHLSPYQTSLIEKLESMGKKRVAGKKLTPNLLKKEKYVIHYRNLKYYMDKGLKLEKIHRIISFEEVAWLQPYIDLCTSKRQQSKTNFEKDFWKLMVNSLYGKSIENKRKHSKVIFLTNQKQIKKVVNKPLFDQFSIINENFVIAKLRRPKVVLDKPIAVGFSVLEFAKLHMYQLHYDTFKSYYGNNIKLLYTDTDKFIYHMKTEDLHVDLEKFGDIMDFCDYPEDHWLYNTQNKKKLGYLKDEMNGSQIHEVIALKSKMYVIVSDDGEKKRSKGTQRCIVEKQLTRDQYFNCLYNEEIFYNVNHRLESKEHKIRAIQVKKISLSPLDDKRWAIDNLALFNYNHNTNNFIIYSTPVSSPINIRYIVPSGVFREFNLITIDNPDPRDLLPPGSYSSESSSSSELEQLSPCSSISSISSNFSTCSTTTVESTYSLLNSESEFIPIRWTEADFQGYREALSESTASGRSSTSLLLWSYHPSRETSPVPSTISSWSEPNSSITNSSNPSPEPTSD
ncbi:uncharacterized protein LOC128395792 [Panonychus citri]|uniref:uncharacterized protein LOC128395792 n=1 Tax=Panonychus citri TaxID=50023 RepID=UPI002307B5E4|nr:uncharacterized protein LOC128395792 [Panonychus citri]